MPCRSTARWSRAHPVDVGCLRTAGFALQEFNLPFHTSAETAAMAASLLEPFPATDFPHLAEQTTEHVLLPCYDYGEEFEFGLTLILDDPNEPERPESQ